MATPEQDLSTNELLANVDALLGSSTMKFEGPKAKDLASGMVSQQNSRWQRLLQSLAPKGSHTQTPYLRSIEALRSAIMSALNWDITEISGGFGVKGQLPLILNDPPQHLLAAAQNQYALVAALVAERCYDALVHVGSSDLVPSITAIGMNKVFDTLHNQVGLRGEFNSELDSLRSLVKEIQSDSTLKASQQSVHIADYLSSIETKNSQLESKSLEAVTRINKLAEEEFPKWELRVAQSIKSLEDEVNEFTKMKASIGLWNTKANWHLGTAILFGALFVLGVAAVPLAIGTGVTDG